MIRIMELGRVAVLGLVATLCGGVAKAQVLSSPNLLPTRIQSPDEFGTIGYTVSNIAAISFYPKDQSRSYFTSGSLGRFGEQYTGPDNQHFLASLEVPEGAVIDYIGLNNFNDGTDSVMGVGLWQRSPGGSLYLISGISSSPHTYWATDHNVSPINYLNPSRLNALILDVEYGPSPNSQFFGSVEVWWRRTVSDPPAIATFTDVPTSHPFFRFVEALYAAGITGGYPDGRFGINDPITRGQMAVFLSTALGLYWPH